MVIRTSRRRFVASAAGLAGLLAVGSAAPAPIAATPIATPPVVAFPPDADDLGARLAYLAGLVARYQYRATRGDTHAADMLACLNRCLDFPISCLDGSFLRDINVA